MSRKSNKTEKANYSYIKNFGYLFLEMHKYSKWNMPLYLGDFLCGVLSTYITIFFSKWLVQLVLEEAGIKFTVFVCAGFGVLVLILRILYSQASGQLKTQCLKMRHYFQKKILTKLNNTEYSNLENPEYRRMVDRAKELYDRWDRDVCECVFNSNDFLQALACFGLSSVMLFQVHPFVILALVLSSIIQYYVAQYHVEWNRTHKNLWQPLSMKIEYLTQKGSDFTYAKDYRIYRANQWLLGKYDNLMRERNTWVMKNAMIHMMTQGAALILQNAGLAVVYFFLIRKVLLGEISGDYFVLYTGLATSLNGSLSSITFYLPLLRKNVISIAEYRQMLEMEDSTRQKESAERPVTVPEKCSITFSHVSFRYPNAEGTTLSDVNFHIQSGEKIAIVGLNGAGKTTLIKLLCGMYQPSEGRILLDGVNGDHWDLQTYYQFFSVVFQDYNVIPATIAENVACVSEEELDRKNVEECLKKAGLWNMVSRLPKGMDTYLRKEMFRDGVNLSGGETQKLLLARAIYKKAPVLILDEPTAALDAIAEQNLYLSYSEMAQNRTSIFISHRLASTRFCDRIFMMQDGKLKECGSHEELMEQKGTYFQLYQVQSHYYQEDRKEEFESSLDKSWEVSSYS